MHPFSNLFSPNIMTWFFRAPLAKKVVCIGDKLNRMLSFVCCFLLFVSWGAVKHHTLRVEGRQFLDLTNSTYTVHIFHSFSADEARCIGDSYPTTIHVGSSRKSGVTFTDETACKIAVQFTFFPLDSGHSVPWINISCSDLFVVMHSNKYLGSKLLPVARRFHKNALVK